jgi:small-conductance mechanosensitive channel
MEKLIDTQTLEAYYLELSRWFVEDVLVLSTLGQVAVIALAFLAALPVAPGLRRWIERLGKTKRMEKGGIQAARVIAPLALPIVWLILQWTSVIVANQAGWPHQLIQITVSLLTAWVVIRLASQLVQDPTWSKLIAISAWTVAALNIVGLLDDAIILLDGLALQLGDLRVSALTAIKGMLSLALLLWLATMLSSLLERRIRTLPNLTPSVQVLFAKLLKIVLITVAIVAALSTVGIDLTAFAVFSGAVGVGIGFGLQKVVSNLISGVILLMDKSVKPGDVISVGETYGWINTLGARYASVVTRDGTEFLIPNEDIITQQVVNWSRSGSRTSQTCVRPSRSASTPLPRWNGSSKRRRAFAC